jgi:hypothetical protein
MGRIDVYLRAPGVGVVAGSGGHYGTSMLLD